MTDFVTINDNGQFELAGERWYCNSVVYFAHYPGAMRNWFEEPWWAPNEAVLDRDFDRMAALGLNHAALFLTNAMFFDNGKPVPDGYRKMDRVVAAAKQSGVRLTLFSGPFIDSEEEYRRITGKDWPCGDQWLPPFNDVLFDAYVEQMRPLCERYRDEPAVLGYADRIDRFHKGFDNVSIPHNLKQEWAAWLKARYGSFAALLEAKGGALEGAPADFDGVLLPQESQWNGSLHNPMAYDYILMQKKEVGDAQARWDARMAETAPKQVFWTPFEGNTNTWAMLDGFTPETKKLQAVWMEYYFFEVTRTHPVQPFEEWVHTPEVIHHRLAHQLPVVYNAAYMMTRYLKQSVQQPVVMCHGAMCDSACYGIETPEQHAAVIDRVNAACLAADGDGWHYWSWTDDYQSKSSHLAEQKRDPTAMYWYGESTGLYDHDDCPRPVVSLVCQYSGEVARRARRNPPPKRSSVLLLSSAPLNYTLFRRLAYPTSAAVSGALTRCGVECDYLWSAQNDVRIPPETLNGYRLIVLADHMYRRDFLDMPDKLLAYVEQGGTLCFALDRWQTIEDQHGVRHDSPALARLSGVDPQGTTAWPGAGEPCHNWPFGTDPAHETNFDAMTFPRLNWGVCPAFRHRAPYAWRSQLLGWRSMDGDTFTVVDGLVEGAEVIAVGKFPAGSRPWIWRHRVGRGTVYVNAWTGNVFRDSDRSIDYGGWDYDWILALAIETSGADDVDLLSSGSVWLRNSWGYFWRES